jgi:hypothetical protein
VLFNVCIVLCLLQSQFSTQCVHSCDMGTNAITPIRQDQVSARLCIGWMHHNVLSKMHISICQAFKPWSYVTCRQY